MRLSRSAIQVLWRAMAPIVGSARCARGSLMCCEATPCPSWKRRERSFATTLPSGSGAKPYLNLTCTSDLRTLATRLQARPCHLKLSLQLIRRVVDRGDSRLAKQVQKIHDRQARDLSALREGRLPRFEQVKGHRAVN